ncbi:MAG: efflux RND transporter periplasmic adaptor subunit [Hyphomicrobiales bacterium]
MRQTKPKSPLGSPIVKRFLTLTGTSAVILLAAGLVFGGVTLLSQRADAVLGPDPAPLTVVSAMTLSPQQGLRVTRRFQGQVEPTQTVNLAFQQAGEIERLTVDEGDSVRAGDVIAQLDTQILDAERARLEASRRAVEAQVELAELTTQRQSELRDRGFASEQTLDTARLTLADLEARIAEIDAGLTRIDVQLAQTRLIAPFDGTIATRLADEGTVASVGQPIVEVLQSSAPLFRVGIDPTLADDQDALAQVSIAINGLDYDASFDGFRPDLDPQTRTRTALFRLETDDAVYLDAGTLTLQPTLDQQGYLVPLNALQDGVRGLWTVLSLQPGEGSNTFTVGREAVEILHIEGDQAFVRGTFEGDLLIIGDGTHRVVPGAQVRLAEPIAEPLAQPGEG